MSEHTPGPWSVQQFNVALPSARYKPVWLLNAAGERMYCIGATDAVLPDAHLIAAAPDLLAALKAVVEHVEDEGAARIGNQCTLCFTYRAMARAAIAKAEAA